MAAPALVTRLSPNTIGRPLVNGYVAVYAFQFVPSLTLWEVEVTPYGLDNGDEIDTTTMWNTIVRTKHPRALQEYTNGSMRCAYDPAVWSSQLFTVIGINGGITITFPNGDTDTVWGYLKSFKPNGMQDGTFPLADCDVVVTSWDSVNCIENTGSFVSASGTC